MSDGETNNIDDKERKEFVKIGGREFSSMYIVGGTIIQSLQWKKGNELLDNAGETDYFSAIMMLYVHIAKKKLERYSNPDVKYPG